MRFELPKRFVEWAKRSSWLGFQQVSLYDAIAFFIAEIKRTDIVTRSQAIAFSFFISIFPAVLVIFTLVPYLNLDTSLIDGLEVYVYDLLPGQSASVAMTLIYDILGRERSGLLSLSFILAIYFSSNGMMALLRSFDKEGYEEMYRKRGVIRSRIIALGLTLLLGVLLLVSLALITAGSQAILWFSERYQVAWSTQFVLRLLQWSGITALLYSAIALMYRYGAATFKRFPLFSPGTTVATFLTVLTSLGFAIYVDNFDAYNKLYGSIGTVIIFMLWLQFNTLWLLIGYELNASISLVRGRMSLSEERQA